MDQFRPTSDDEKAAKEGVLIAFAELADQMDKLKARAKRKFAAFETSSTESAVEGADELASIEHKRDAAFSDLSDATTLTLLTILTTSSPEAQRVNALKLSCAEKIKLQQQSAVVASDKVGKFTPYVDLIAAQLRKPYACRVPHS